MSDAVAFVSETEFSDKAIGSLSAVKTANMTNEYEAGLLFHVGAERIILSAQSFADIEPETALLASPASETR